jgi:hypothetical protein
VALFLAHQQRRGIRRGASYVSIIFPFDHLLPGYIHPCSTRFRSGGLNLYADWDSQFLYLAAEGVATSTRVEFFLLQTERIRCEIYDIQGRRVIILASDLLPAGYYSLSWNGRNQQGLLVSSGIYFVRLNTNKMYQTKKLVFIK